MAIAISEAEILEKVVRRPRRLSPEAARAVLELRFDARTQATIRKLLRKNQAGKITASERLALDRYLRVGQLLDLLHAEMRLTLRHNGNAR
jgi:hypothetical protein